MGAAFAGTSPHAPKFDGCNMRLSTTHNDRVALQQVVTRLSRGTRRSSCAAAYSLRSVKRVSSTAAAGSNATSPRSVTIIFQSLPNGTSRTRCRSAISWPMAPTGGRRFIRLTTSSGRPGRYATAATRSTTTLRPRKLANGTSVARNATDRAAHMWSGRWRAPSSTQRVSTTCTPAIPASSVRAACGNNRATHHATGSTGSECIA